VAKSNRPAQGGARNPDRSRIHFGNIAGVGVEQLGAGHALVATAPIAAEQRIMTIEGALVDRPTRMSLQVGVGEHLEVPPGWSARRILDDCPWVYLNHSCDPNARILGRELVSLRPIGRFEEITFDYNTTEEELSCPFVCSCGSASCTGAVVRGYRHLSDEERLRLEPRLAEHLRRLAPSRGQAARGPVR